MIVLWWVLGGVQVCVGGGVRGGGDGVYGWVGVGVYWGRAVVVVGGGVRVYRGATAFGRPQRASWRVRHRSIPHRMTQQTNQPTHHQHQITLAVVSSEHEASSVPVGSHATVFTSSAWPCRVGVGVGVIGCGCVWPCCVGVWVCFCFHRRGITATNERNKRTSAPPKLRRRVAGQASIPPPPKATHPERLYWPFRLRQVEELDGLVRRARGEGGVVPPRQVQDGRLVHVRPLLPRLFLVC